MKARTTLESCLDNRPGDKGVHGALARLLTEHFPDDRLKAEYHWERSYTKGDASYSNQFWHARQLFVNGKITESQRLFRALRSARVPPDVRNKLRGSLLASNGPTIRYQGRVERLEATYALVSRIDAKEWAFLHRTRVRRGEWDRLERYTPVNFRLAFTYNGLAAFDVKLER